MENESQMREGVRKESSRILYEDERYMIGVSSMGTDEHNLLVNDSYAFLGRGIFNELARADVRRLESSLRMVGEEVWHEMRKRNISLEELGWVLAKAAIKDKEDYASYLVDQQD
ncbi:hypothetical protein HN903_02170 [archaeon]|jgi:hypothetical protein|nr:hypothetical protein [archaeon]MBT7128538.1 hypothetical protein [archaeon]